MGECTSRKWPRYASCKDSGTAWLGQVPHHWEVERLKTVASLVTTKAETAAFPVALENIEGWTGRFIETESEFQADGIAFRQGDVLFGKLRPYLAKAWLADRVGESVGDIFTLRPGKCLLGKYLRNVLVTPQVIAVLDGSTFGSKMPRVSWDFMSTVRVPVPPIEEQQAICRFIDRESLAIDLLIAKQERLIDLLTEKRHSIIRHALTSGLQPGVEMKGTNDPWLGVVPSGWVVAPIGARYEVQLGKMLDEKRISGDHLAPYLRNVDVQWDRISVIDLPQMDFGPADRQKFGLQAGDLLVCEGGDVGRAAIWDATLPECYYQKALHRLRPIRQNRDIPRFMFYLLMFAHRQQRFTAGSGKATIAHLPAEALRRYRFAFPSPHEQRAIVQHLDAEISKLDALIAKCRRAIDLLREHRSSLISAVVTGKIRVTEDVAASDEMAIA